MDYDAFLIRVIDDALAGARADYKPETPKLKGSVAGLEACRGRSPEDLVALRDGARESVQQARRDGVGLSEYWELRCFELEVGWVCDCVTAAGFARLGPTYGRAMLKAADVLGIRPYPAPATGGEA